MKYISLPKKELWRQIKEIRKLIKEKPIGSTHLRIVLNQLLDRHKEALQAEREEIQRVLELVKKSKIVNFNTESKLT